ncbi:MAG TPA: phosphatase PAP2 family protein [Cytophagaceae bacterium]|jgi:membrane-associated phospholipid phosphatase|nr:phosphatase PAP2 family protein [Cytophagaceae bacterium]
MHRKILRRALALLTLFSVEIIFIWVVFLGSLLIFSKVVGEVFIEKEQGFEAKAFAFTSHIASPMMTQTMLGISLLASVEFISGVAAGIFVYFLFIRKHAWYSLRIPVVALGSISLNLIMKWLFDRPRPALEHLTEVSGLSFPSGHAMMSFSFYGLLIYLIFENIKNRSLRYVLCFVLLILMHLIGLSRVYLHVHYASDVLAGFALGTVWLIICLFILKKIENYSKSKLDPVIESE